MGPSIRGNSTALSRNMTFAEILLAQFPLVNGKFMICRNVLGRNVIADMSLYFDI